MKNNARGKKFAYCCIILVALLLFAIYVLFFMRNSKFSFFPYVLGTLTAAAIYIVRLHNQKPIEIDLFKKEEEDQSTQNTDE